MRDNIDKDVCVCVCVRACLYLYRIKDGLMPKHKNSLTCVWLNIEDMSRKVQSD